MPRRSVDDAPGAIHPIITRGINRQRIFKDGNERENFIDRLVISFRKPEPTGLPREKLGISQPVRLDVRRGEQLAHSSRYCLKDLE